MGEPAAGPALRRGVDWRCQGPLAWSEERCTRITDVVGSNSSRYERLPSFSTDTHTLLTTTSLVKEYPISWQ